MIFDSIYQKGYEAGINAQKCSDHEDQNRRLQDMLEYGKEIGYNKGREDGLQEGYRIGYDCGKDDVLSKHGIVEIDDINEVAE